MCSYNVWFFFNVAQVIAFAISYLQEALTIFEKQENWGSVIDCYQSLGQLEKAERLVRDLITENKNESTYWCLLGDILHEPIAYKKAIEVAKSFWILQINFSSFSNLAIFFHIITERVLSFLEILLLNIIFLKNDFP